MALTCPAAMLLPHDEIVVEGLRLKVAEVRTARGLTVIEFRGLDYGLVVRCGCRRDRR